MSNIEAKGIVCLEGLVEDKNASAVSFWQRRALVVSDEAKHGNLVQIFASDGENHFSAAGQVVLDPPGVAPEEMDLEGIAVDGATVYVLGSHSSRRKKVGAKVSRIANRAALMSAPEAQPARDVLLRFRLGSDGKPGAIERTSLRPYLDATEPFKSFGRIASKENGVDLEGLAAWRGDLYVGFRGPVLRGNFTPILRCGFGSPIATPGLLFVDLGGRGVRDLAHARDGLLILAGPVGDGPGTYQLYFWDGQDGVPGSDAPAAAASSLQPLGDLLPPPGQEAAKAEGVGLIDEGDRHWHILVVFDGLKDGHATRYRAEKPVAPPASPERQIRS
jgi:hypothetical protein